VGYAMSHFHVQISDRLKKKLSEINTPAYYAECQVTNREVLKHWTRTAFGLVLRNRSNIDAFSASNNEPEMDVKGYEPFRQFLASQVSTLYISSSASLGQGAK